MKVSEAHSSCRLSSYEMLALTFKYANLQTLAILYMKMVQYMMTSQYTMMSQYTKMTKTQRAQTKMKMEP